MLETYKNFIDERLNNYSKSNCFSYIDSNNSINSINYERINENIRNLKSIFSSLGIKPGHKVCLISNNLLYSQITFLSLSYLNICTVFIDPKLPISQIKEMISKVEFSLFLMDKNSYDKLSSIISYKALDITNNYEHLNYPIINIVEQGDLDEIAIIFSSGTTSSMKPIVLSYKSIINSVVSTSVVVENDNKNVLNLLPLYHISGLINLLYTLYNNLVVLTVEYFSLNDIVSILTTLNPNSFVITPLVIDKLIDELEIHLKNKSIFIFDVYETLCNISLSFKKHFSFSLKSLLKPFYKKIFGNEFKYLICSSSQLTQKVIDRINSYGIILYNLYASSECGCPITHTYGIKAFDNTVGRIDSNPKVSLKLINMDENNIGEICVMTNSIMKCYYNDFDTTFASFTEDGYFKTGDLGKIINGYLYICGRNKESIKLKNGKKLSPNDLEELLRPIYPENNKVYICGYSKNNDEYDDIYAFVLNKSYTLGQKNSIKSKIIEYNDEVLKSYPIKDVVFVDSIPFNSLGKIKRYELVKSIDEDEKTSEFSSDILNIISKYISVGDDFVLNKRLNELGIDSLSMYSIVLDIKEKFNKDISPFLTSNTTVNDLIHTVEKNKNADIKLRKIKPDEIVEMAKLAADCFYDYPLYKIFYPDDNQRKVLMFYNCWFVMYKRQNYSYITDDKSVYIAFKKPNDKPHSLFGLFFKYRFVTKFFSSGSTIKALKLLQSYGVFSNKIMNKYFNPKEDNYIENMFIKKDKQGNGMIFNVLSCLDDGNNIYAETHLKENAQLFEKLGMEICEISTWKGVDHYALYKKNQF